jgi:spore coat polysaccharide biosynthesis predicted glycosyltransferase SpsG
LTRAVLRCDGSAEIGLGHVVRCLAVAEELAALGADVSFATRPDPAASATIACGGFPVDGPEAAGEADLVLFDVRDDTARGDLETLRSDGTVVGVLDDGSDRRLGADLAFYPPVPRVSRLDWDGFTGRLCCGWDWIALRAAFARPRSRRIAHVPPRVLVACGGSDPGGLTLQTVRALELVDDPVAPVLLLGSAFAHRAALDSLLRASRHRYELCVDPRDPAAALADADLAVASFGMTAYELAALGVPALYLCLTDDHADSARALNDAGAGRSLGRHDLVSGHELAGAIARLASSPSPVPPLVDGLGARRIATELLGLAAPSTLLPERTIA